MGLRPAVVIHSIGYREVPPGKSEIRPAWFEAAIQADWTDTYRAPDGSFVLGVVEPPVIDRSVLISVLPG
jgi:hypothetical protein